MPPDPAMSTSAVSAAAVAAAKKQLRQLMKQRLTALSATTIAEESSAIFRALVTFPPYIRAHRVAVFLSMPTAEVQTDAIVRHALAAGKQVFVPYLHKPAPTIPAPMPRVMDMVRLHGCADYELLARDRWGIPSVSPDTVHERPRILGDGMLSRSPYDDPDTPPSHLDLVLLPGVAFDVDPATGRIRRCGHGRGFYDYFLHRYAHQSSSQVSLSSSSSSSSSSSPYLCGLALTDQVLPGPAGSAVPTGLHDEPLDSLITGSGTIVTTPQIDE